MKKILNHLFEHRDLTYKEAYEVLTKIAQGLYNDCEIAAFLTVYIMRSISVDELAGFRDALLDLCIRVDLSDHNTIDLCGTGGDGKDTFNISTLTSFVVAGAGYKVSKHGNYGVSSGCGSSNVMEFLGYEFTNDISRIRKEIDKAGICFLHAPLFHPAMKNVGPVRRHLKVKTFFNMLGPMVNPSFPQNQAVGVFNLELARIYSYLYQRSDKNYVILHSLDGYDEISLTGDFKAISNQGERLLNPGYFGFEKLKASELSGGSTVSEAASIFGNILRGEGTAAQNNAVVANAAIAIQTIDQKKNIENCIEEARISLYDKKALKTFKTLLNN